MKPTSFVYFCYCAFIILVLQSAFWVEASQVSRCALKSRRADSAVKVGLEPIASGFNQPVYVTNAGDGSNRLFVVEKTGRIRIMDQKGSRDKPFLDVHDLVATDGEQGLLSVAFHPKFETNGRLFVFYSEASTGHSVIAEYHVDADQPHQVTSSEKRILIIPQTEVPVHRGGQLMFGPDDYLYISLGNGGAPENSQSLMNLPGAILRLDINSSSPYAIPPDNPFVKDLSARPEIWAYGFRNPWRFSIDSCTGRLFVGDVGDAETEEIDWVKPGGNYGFNLMEGDHCYVHPLEEDAWLKKLLRRVCGAAAFEKPIYAYNSLSEDERGGESVIGGFFYRGLLFPQLVGRYLFGDLVSGRIWIMSENHAGWQVHEGLDSDFVFSSFGEDEDGELYVLHYNRDNGALFRIVVE